MNNSSTWFGVSPLESQLASLNEAEPAALNSAPGTDEALQLEAGQ